MYWFLGSSLSENLQSSSTSDNQRNESDLQCTASASKHQRELSASKHQRVLSASDHQPHSSLASITSAQNKCSPKKVFSKKSTSNNKDEESDITTSTNYTGTVL